MKLTHFALVLTLVLLGVTGWLAWDQHSDAKGARNQLELYKRQKGGDAPARTANESEMQAKENQLLMAQMTANKLPEPPPPLTPAKSDGGNPASAALASSGHVSPEALAAAPPALTPRQRLLMSLPAIGKISESQQKYGFVVITAGSNKKLESGSLFALRRGNAIIGRIRISDVENTSAVANLQPGSVPPGVEIQLGDDIVQDLPPES